jgi:hypothetical protein
MLTLMLVENSPLYSAKVLSMVATMGALPPIVASKKAVNVNVANADGAPRIKAPSSKSCGTKRFFMFLRHPPGSVPPVP